MTDGRAESEFATAPTTTIKQEFLESTDSNPSSFSAVPDSPEAIKAEAEHRIELLKYATQKEIAQCLMSTKPESLSHYYFLAFKNNPVPRIPKKHVEEITKSHNSYGSETRRYAMNKGKKFQDIGLTINAEKEPLRDPVIAWLLQSTRVSVSYAAGIPAETQSLHDKAEALLPKLPEPMAKMLNFFIGQHFGIPLGQLAELSGKSVYEVSELITNLNRNHLRKTWPTIEFTARGLTIAVRNGIAILANYNNTEMEPITTITVINNAATREKLSKLTPAMVKSERDALAETRAEPEGVKGKLAAALAPAPATTPPPTTIARILSSPATPEQLEGGESILQFIRENCTNFGGVKNKSYKIIRLIAHNLARKRRATTHSELEAQVGGFDQHSLHMGVRRQLKTTKFKLILTNVDTPTGPGYILEWETTPPPPPVTGTLQKKPIIPDLSPLYRNPDRPFVEYIGNNLDAFNGNKKCMEFVKRLATIAEHSDDPISTEALSNMTGIPKNKIAIAVGTAKSILNTIGLSIEIFTLPDEDTFYRLTWKASERPRDGSGSASAQSPSPRPPTPITTRSGALEANIAAVTSKPSSAPARTPAPSDPSKPAKPKPYDADGRISYIWNQPVLTLAAIKHVIIRALMEMQTDNSGLSVSDLRILKDNLDQIKISTSFVPSLERYKKLLGTAIGRALGGKIQQKHLQSLLQGVK